MKLKPIPLLLLPALMVLLACGGASEPAPDIGATIEPKVKAVRTPVQGDPHFLGRLPVSAGGYLQDVVSVVPSPAF